MDTKQEINREGEGLDLLANVVPDYKLYHINQMVVASMFGGPFAGAYMISSNIRQMKAPIAVWKVWAALFVILLLSFVPDFLGAEDDLPNLVYGVIYCAAIYMLARYFIGKKMKAHQAMGGLYWGFGRVLLVIIISLSVFALLVFTMFIAADFQTFKNAFL